MLNLVESVREQGKYKYLCINRANKVISEYTITWIKYIFLLLSLSFNLLDLFWHMNSQNSCLNIANIKSGQDNSQRCNSGRRLTGYIWTKCTNINWAFQSWISIKRKCITCWIIKWLLWLCRQPDNTDFRGRIILSLILIGNNPRIHSHPLDKFILEQNINTNSPVANFIKIWSNSWRKTYPKNEIMGKYCFKNNYMSKWLQTNIFPLL